MKYNSPLVCRHPMFLRRLGKCKKTPYHRNGNKFKTAALVVSKAVKLGSKCDPLAECKRNKITIYNGVHTYHQSITPNAALKSATAFSFGLELETVAKTFQHAMSITCGNKLQSNWLFVSRDGSLPLAGQMGVELGTIPLPSAYALSLPLWEDVTKYLRSFLYAAPDTSCGLHVHVGTQHLLPTHPLYNRDEWVGVFRYLLEYIYEAIPQESIAFTPDLIRSTLNRFMYLGSVKETSVQAYEELVKMTNVVSMYVLYEAFQRLSDITGLPCIKMNDPVRGEGCTINAARCATPGSFVAVPGNCGTVPSSAMREDRTITGCYEASCCSSSLIHLENFAMNEHSLRYGTRVNPLRCLLAPRKVDEWEHPFLSVLFGRCNTNYCASIYPTQAYSNLIMGDSYRYDDIILQNPKEFTYDFDKYLEFLAEKYGQSDYNTAVLLLPIYMRKMTTERELLATSFYPHQVEKFIIRYMGRTDAVVIEVLCALLAYLHYSWQPPSYYLNILTTHNKYSLKWNMVIIAVLSKFIPEDYYCDNFAHHHEICLTNTTMEFRRGKATLNPQRIHSILTFLYYISSTSATFPITARNVNDVARKLITSLRNQTHSPLLSHYISTCFHPYLTGLTAEEVLHRSAPVLTGTVSEND